MWMEYEKFRNKIRLDTITKNWYKIEQGQMRIISDMLSDDFEIIRCNIYLVDVLPEEDAHAIYYTVQGSCFILTEVKSIFIILHELSHHIQKNIYRSEWLNGTPHDNSFTKAINKVCNWANKNIVDAFEPFMLRQFYMSNKEN